MLLSEEKISLLKPNKLINFVIMLTAENFPHDWYCQNLLVHGVHAVGEGEVDVVECKKHELNLCTVLSSPGLAQPRPIFINDALLLTDPGSP